ncbi:CoA transferase [Rhizobium leguminosarum]|uniref:CoA transferase n=1 Tax=Rhizobium leguminosarum TaxID=384 RepID=UPI0028F443E0|nr:CoA transferase [Rhizobium leguminosarum]
MMPPDPNLSRQQQRIHHCPSKTPHTAATPKRRRSVKHRTTTKTAHSPNPNQRGGEKSGLDAIINARFAELTSDEAMKELEAAGLAYGRLNQVADVSQHPHLRRLGVATPGGEVEMIAPAAVFDGDKAPMFRPVPSPGSHTEALKEEFKSSTRQRANN